MWIYGTISDSIIDTVLKKNATARDSWLSIESLFRDNKEASCPSTQKRVGHHGHRRSLHEFARRWRQPLISLPPSMLPFPNAPWSLIYWTASMTSLIPLSTLFSIRCHSRLSLKPDRCSRWKRPSLQTTQTYSSTSWHSIFIDCSLCWYWRKSTQLQQLWPW